MGNSAMNDTSVKTSKPVILQGDCLQYFKTGTINDIDLTFFDPPYNQGKDYSNFNDNQNPDEYWDLIKQVLEGTYNATVEGGAIYFMQREKNAEFVLRSLRETNWTYQNTIIWKKLTSAVPGRYRFGKSYQVIMFATKGRKPRVFNRLRIDPPLPPHYTYERKNGMYATDIWADIRELTSGYFAREEPFRDKTGERIHKQQSPVALLTRIILSSSLADDVVFDPMTGTGTTLVTAYQLKRKSIGIEIDPNNVNLIKKRLEKIRPADDVAKYYKAYQFTPDLDIIWGAKQKKPITLTELKREIPERVPRADKLYLLRDILHLLSKMDGISGKRRLFYEIKKTTQSNVDFSVESTFEDYLISGNILGLIKVKKRALSITKKGKSLVAISKFGERTLNQEEKNLLKSLLLTYPQFRSFISLGFCEGNAFDSENELFRCARAKCPSRESLLGVYMQTKGQNTDREARTLLGWAIQIGLMEFDEFGEKYYLVKERNIDLDTFLTELNDAYLQVRTTRTKMILIPQVRLQYCCSTNTRNVVFDTLLMDAYEKIPTKVHLGKGSSSREDVVRFGIRDKKSYYYYLRIVNE